MNILLALPDSSTRSHLRHALLQLDLPDVSEADDLASALSAGLLYPPTTVVFLDAEDATLVSGHLENALAPLPERPGIVLVESTGTTCPVQPGLPAIRPPFDPAQIAPLLGVPLPAFEAESAPESFFGNYRLLHSLGTDASGQHYAAEQTNLKRPVTLSLLGPDIAPREREIFLRELQARSRVLHPLILTVYEAGEAGGWLYSAAERVEATPLGEYLQNGQKLPIRTLLRTAHAVGTALQYLRETGIRYLPLDAAHILLPAQGPPRLANTATARADDPRNRESDFAVFGKFLLALAPPEAPSSLRSLLDRTQMATQNRFQSWESFLEALRAWEWHPSHSRYLSAEGQGPGAQRRRIRRSHPSRWLSGALAACALGAAGLAFWGRVHALNSAPHPPQVQVPAGEYLLGGGTLVQMPAFSIDQTEVSNRHYAAFLRWAHQHPSQSRRYDHPDQPAAWSHIPLDGETLFSAPPAPTADAPVWDLPVRGVGWWDAYAFAQWSGRALPSQEEWEAAARGPRGLLFPWGDAWKSQRAGVLSGGSASPAPGPTGVSTQRDAGPEGTVGMAGNVAEWTDSLAPNQNRVAKGGHFLAPLQTLDTSQEFPPETRLPQLGFRTRSRKN